MIETKTWSPVGSAKQRLYNACEVRKTVAHQEEPNTEQINNGDVVSSTLYDASGVAPAMRHRVILVYPPTDSMAPEGNEHPANASKEHNSQVYLTLCIKRL